MSTTNANRRFIGCARNILVRDQHPGNYQLVHMGNATLSFTHRVTATIH
jgi:hypothetical protein